MEFVIIIQKQIIKIQYNLDYVANFEIHARAQSSNSAWHIIGMK